MKKQFLILLIATFLFSCTNYDKDKWSIFYGMGIENGSFEILKFKNDSIGYLGGRLSSYEYDDKGTLKPRPDSTLLYKTVNGGKIWKPINLNQKGQISDIKFYGEKTYLLNQYHDTRSEISVSSSNETKWQSLIKFGKGDYVRDYEYLKNNELLVIVSNNSNVTLLRVTNIIDTIKTFSSQNYKAKIKNGTIYMIYNSGGAYSDGIMLYDYFSDKTTQIPFDKDYWVYSTYINKKNEFFVAVQNNTDKKSKIFNLSNGKLTEISLNTYERYSLGQIYVTDDLIFINSNKPEKVGPIGVTHELLYSTNGGKDWNNESYPYSLIVEPAFLKTNGNYITYQGMKKFQEIHTFSNKMHKQ